MASFSVLQTILLNTSIVLGPALTLKYFGRGDRKYIRMAYHLCIFLLAADVFVFWVLGEMPPQRLSKPGNAADRMGAGRQGGWHMLAGLVGCVCAFVCGRLRRFCVDACV